MQIQSTNTVDTSVTPFKDKINFPLTKKRITVLQINIGRRCNLACTHCHVEASPKRTEELSPEVCEQLISIIKRFPEIKIVDLTGGAPEMNYGFKPLVEAAKLAGKQVIVRSNLTIYFENGFGNLPEYFAKHELKIVASLPCYLSDNVDKMRGVGVFESSIKALQWLNQLGYGKESNLILDLVFNPQLPTAEKFSLAPEQSKLEQDYKIFLQKHFNIVFNNLFTITNLPVGRTKMYLERRKLYASYLQFLESHFNSSTIEHLMCRDEISIDYLGNVYDCDFNQMMNIPAKTRKGENLTVTKLLEVGSLDLINEVQTAPYCYGCTAGFGSSCSGALL
ncbi:radical SAM protein [Nostoc linckia z18]|jgi:radical SAM/Cys-rich protein|uniref:Radical SAM protein n=2 Tax=Nostoc linckia TaxID=92942 RepID=A0A9Q5ZFC1_NOSLI|nr:arsenosugar biosynthesis radical SAM (seleno)protein ArsS [Nostoc linckia]PHK29782.1 radical SAM protein [Nostoc linckia z15]PHK46284.1 radical SAM protein [Nostoc linckia z16]PHJ66539.1 radical SAM protein [Nostoc linckia z1]PHJ71414.1 radical SAM protein [Nostoc linckia z3]PHJ75446.1 radical SAM protein [Nostoc linckia z2]